MAFEVDIAMSKPKVVDASAGQDEFVEVEAHLDPAPADDWRVIFLRGPADVEQPLGVYQPRLDGTTLRLRVPDKHMEYVAYLRARVEGTNAEYNREVAPRLASDHERRHQQQTDHDRRIDEAQRTLDESPD
jgi:hypothetical protein